MIKISFGCHVPQSERGSMAAPGLPSAIPPMPGQSPVRHLLGPSLTHGVQEKCMHRNDCEGPVDNLDRILRILKLRIPRELYHIHCDGALFAMIMPFVDYAPEISFKSPLTAWL